MPTRKVYAAKLPNEALANLIAQLFEFVSGVDTYSRNMTHLAVAIYEDEFYGVEKLIEAGFVEYPSDSEPCDIVYRGRDIEPLG